MKWMSIFLFGISLIILGCETTDQYDAEYMGGAPSVKNGSGGIANATGGVTSKTTVTSVSKGGAISSTKISTGGFSSTRSISTGGFVSTNTTRVSVSTGGFVSTQVASTGGLQMVTTSCTDCDGDGESASTDCNDFNRFMSHSLAEVCNNGIDDNCNGAQDCTDSACSSSASCQVDADGDGESSATDCNDFDASMSHAHPEICNLDGKDEDCDAMADCSDPDCEASSYCL